MKKRTKILSCSFLVGLLTLSGLSFVLTRTRYGKAEALEGEFVSTEELPSSFALGEEFVVPQGKINVDGQTYNYNDYYLTYPHGKSYKQESYILDVAGQYDCTFIYKTASNNIYSHYIFNVYDGMFTLNSPNSHAEYVENVPTFYSDTPGYTVQLAENDTFALNEIVDASDASLDEPLVVYSPHAHSLRANPANADKDMTPNIIYDCADPNKPKPLPIDANGSVVKITDAYDPSIYFEVFIFYRVANTSNDRRQQYCVAGPSGNTPTGLEPGSSVGTADRLLGLDGESYRVYMGKDAKSFGTTLNTRTGSIFEYRDEEKPRTTIGSTNDPKTAADLSNTDDCGFSIYYDVATKRVYVKHVATKLITDLDDPTLYGNSPFPGFTTGEVYVSISGMEYNDAVAGYDLVHLKGVDNLAESQVGDTKAPIINLENNSNNFYIAVGEKFDLFEANVIDVNFDGNLETAVYLEYETASQIQVPVIDNAFTPTRPGTYTVIYSAKDTYGNVGTYEMTLYAITTSTGKIVDFSVDKVVEAEAGQEITLPTPNIISYNNEPIIKAYAVFEDGEVTNINTNTWKFFIKKVGTYDIVYEYGDGIKTYEYSYQLTSTTSSNFYLEDISFPKYIIKEASYSLDDCRVVKVATKDLSYETPVVYINEDNAGFNRVIDPKNFSTTATNTVQFKFEYDDTTLLTSETIPVKDVVFKTKLDKQLYFENRNIVTSATSSAISLNTNVAAGNATSTFINPLNFSSLQLKFDLRASVIKAEKLEIELTDFKDEDNKFVFTFYRKGSSLHVSFNGKIDFEINEGTYSLVYDPVNKLLSDTFENSLEMANPFLTDRFYLSFRFVELEGNSSLFINSINEQILNNTYYDSKPGNIVAPSIENAHPLNSKTTLEFFYPEDVFSPYLESNHKVQVVYFKDFDTQDEFEFVVADDGTVLDGTQNVKQTYVFTLAKVGVYQVIYTYDDQCHTNGVLRPKTAEELKTIYSVDDKAPVIVLNDNYGQDTIVQASLNSTHSIKGYKVSDDVDAKVEVKTYCVTPSAVFVDITNGQIKLTERGDYKIYYYAKDSTGNVSSVYYTVRVI